MTERNDYRNDPPLAGRWPAARPAAAEFRFLLAGRTVRSRITPSCLAVLFLLLVSASQAAAASTEATVTTPDLSVGAKQFPDDDAINLRWEQHWTLEKDGSVRRREHRWLKLLNSRPIRGHADPRIAYCDGREELIIHTAQCIRPDGTALPVADYSFNLTAPDDVGGWPQYASWREMVVSFGGIEDNAVLELDYEVVTQPGVLPWISADLRVDSDYPVLQRVVSVTVPEGTVLRYRADGPLARVDKPAQTAKDGMVGYSWTFADLPAGPAEPQSLPWRQRCPRLRFTTCPSATVLVSKAIESVDRAAQVDATVREWALATVDKEADPTEQVRKVAKKLGDSFNFLNSPKTFRSFDCRPAAEVLRSNYGNPLESATLLASALQALGVDPSIEVAVDALAWDKEVPTDSALAGVVVAAELPDGSVHVHPQKGIIRNPGSWGRHELLGRSESGELRRTYIESRGEKTPSEIHITGKVAVDDKGNAAGDLRFRLTGGFYDPAKLESAKQQESLIKNLVGRVLTDFEVSGHSIATLSDEALRATASVASKETLKEYGKNHLLTLGDGPAFLKDFPLPLKRSRRETAVRLGGRLSENIDLTIELPEGWAAAIFPSTLDAVSGAWGVVSQRVEVDGRTVRFRRMADITADTFAPNDFATLREAVNTLSATRSLHLFCGK